MNKTLKLIERILFYTYIFFLVFGAWLVFAAGYMSNYRDVHNAAKFLFQGLFSKAAMRNLLIIFIVIIVFAFAGLWIRASVALNSFTFGPIYLILFFVTFLFTNGYYNSVPEVNLDAKILAITSGLLLFNLFYSMVVFFITTSPVKQIKQAEEMEEQTEVVQKEAPVQNEQPTEPKKESVVDSIVTPSHGEVEESETEEETPTEESVEEAQEEQPTEEEMVEEQESEETEVEEEAQEEDSTEVEEDTEVEESIVEEIPTEEPQEDEEETKEEEPSEEETPIEEAQDIYTATEPEEVQMINEDELEDPLDKEESNDDDMEKLDASEALRPPRAPDRWHRPRGGS